MQAYFLPAAILLIILFSLQYSVNRIIVLLKEIKEILLRIDNYHR